ncbi:hypothetical protein [Kytococcus sp. Marseille-QA3725]
MTGASPMQGTPLPTHGGHEHASGQLDLGDWLASAGLGAFHGLNPGMGWLFAVSYGLQQKSRRALLGAIVPIALGHELSVLPTALVVALFAGAVSHAVALAVVAVALLVFGVYLLGRRRHFRWVGMRLSFWELTWWSFLMSTTTGAGLMLAPVVVGANAPDADGLTLALGSAMWQAALLALVHALAMAAVSAVMALAVYEVLGLKVLRSHWVNLDRLWAWTFVLAGVIVAITWGVALLR